ncbi:unnamed protein product, partial [Rotaria socialis]
ILELSKFKSSTHTYTPPLSTCNVRPTTHFNIAHLVPDASTISLPHAASIQQESYLSSSTAGNDLVADSSCLTKNSQSNTIDNNKWITMSKDRVWCPNSVGKKNIFSKHVIVTSTTRHVFEKNGGSGKQYTTALIGISAAGQVISPFIIYSGKTLMNTWSRGGPDGSRYAVTKKGWIDSCSFEFWLREMFIPATKHLNRPLLLIMDGHNSHIDVNIIQLLKQNRIVCLILPPHCTHGLQPIDVVLFNNVKTDWSSIVSNYLKSGNETIKNADIPRLMKQLFFEKQTFSTTRIVSSFSRSGIWPFNENAMMDKVVATPFSSSSTLTIINTTPIPTNILIPPTSASFAPSSSVTLSASPPITSLSSPPMNLSNIDRTNETLNSDIMTIDKTNGRKDQVLFNIQQIKPIEPTYIDDDEMPSSSEATYPSRTSCKQDLGILDRQVRSY